MIIGIISDTHGYLSARASDALQGVDRILHAGDIDGPEVLKKIAEIAPITAIRGNMDHGSWADDIPATDLLEIDEIWVYMIHNLETLDLDPVASSIKVVISGHTHQPDIQYHQDVLYLNPGSASYGRYGSAPSIAILEISSGRLQPRIILLDA